MFMYQTVHELARLCELHLIVLLDFAHERPAHEELDRICASTEYLVRPVGRPKQLGSIEPHAVREFRIPDLAWLIHRQIYTKKIDVLQLEYTVLGQYAGEFRRIPSILFEHDVYFQSIARRLPFMADFTEKISARWEYLRSLRWELRMLPRSTAFKSVAVITRITCYRSCRVERADRRRLSRRNRNLSLHLSAGRPEAVHYSVFGQLPAHSQSRSIDLVRRTGTAFSDRRRAARAGIGGRLGAAAA